MNSKTTLKWMKSKWKQKIQSFWLTSKAPPFDELTLIKNIIKSVYQSM